MKPDARIAATEWEVMKVVWKRKSCSAQQVIADLTLSTGWSAATIKTLLNRLLRKGALAFTKTGKAYLYTAVWTEDDCRKAESESFLDRVFDGAVTPMLAHFVRSRRLTAAELGELERILKEGR